MNQEKLQIREARDVKTKAERRALRKEKNNKKGKKAKKDKKSNKGKKAAKKSKKAKKGKQVKKEKKSKKAMKKQKKAGKEERKKKTMRGSARQTTCNADEECLSLASKYMKQVKDKVKNFMAQKGRIEKATSLANSKAGKKGDFSADLARLKEAGGGNSSALKCQGKESGAGQAAIKVAVDALEACQNNIKAACETENPVYNSTEADTCEKKMKKFSDAVEACTKEQDATKICACWKKAELKTASEEILNCDLKDKNAEFVKYRTSCIKSFSTCRQTQDNASSIIFSCSPANSADKLLAKLKGLMDNKDSIDKLSATAKSKSSGSRIKRAASCSSFIVSCKKVAELALEFISSPKIKEMADAANADPPAACTPDEKLSLKATVSSLEKASAAAGAAISEVQATLQGKNLLMKCLNYLLLIYSTIEVKKL